MKKVLVTGGAGYIGGFMVRSLIEKEFNVIVLDNLKRGSKDSISSNVTFIEGDLLNKNDLENLFKENEIDSILHFAGLISVEESSKNPDLYFENNINGSQNLFNTAYEFGVKKFIFSSTAAVYGNPIEVPIPEDHPKNPTSPYGESKLMTERNLEKMRDDDNSISFAALRYFNACGASLDGSLGERHDPETHIIPLAIRAALKNTSFKLYGTDYDTRDGTCVRDYIHVLDLVEAHLLALKKIDGQSGSFYYNVGTGHGFSNREVINMVKEISGSDFPIIEEKRRAGDSSELVADVTKIKEELGFSPKYSDLKTIVESAWKWHSSQK